MPLTNSQYDEVMRMYDARRDEHRLILDTRTAEIAEKIPRIAELDGEIRTMSIEAASAALAGKEQDLGAYRDRMTEAAEEKKALLAANGYPEDYLDMIYTCPVCRDTGIADGALCACFRRAAADLLYRRYSIGGILLAENFDHFSYEVYSDTIKDGQTGKTPRQTAEEAVAEARELIAGAGRTGKSLFLYGHTGVGKTFLSHCVAKELLDRSMSVLYFSAQDLFDLLADETFGGGQRESTAMESILACDLLTIDDLGSELTNSFVASQLFHIVNGRILQNRSTIISTNLDLEEFAGRYTERIFSRILKSYSIIRLTGDDIRLAGTFNGGKP